jgi:sugar lactone lactonase YvrE
MTPRGLGFPSFLPSAVIAFLAFALALPLGAQTTYTPFRFTTLAGDSGVRGSEDGSGTGAQFNGPGAVAVDGDRNLYVADSGNATIRKITPNGVVTTLAGTPSNGGYADGTGAAAQFGSPNGIAVDGSGNVYVADSYNDAIRKITPGGVVTTFAGIPGRTGGSADGAAAAATFNYPSGVAVDGNGNVYVADSDNGTIRKITPAGVVTTLAGMAGGVGGSADGTAAAARFNFPAGVAVDAGGNVYVADAGNDVIRVITPGGMVTTLAGAAGNPGSADGTGIGAQFNNPTGVAVDGSGNVYVADSGNSAVRMIAQGGIVTTLAGLPGIMGNADGIGPAARFESPGGVAVDGSGGVYIADPEAQTVRVGYAATQIPATVTLGNLYESQYSQGGVTVTTIPAGLQTVITFGYATNGTGSAITNFAPIDELGSFRVFATIVDPYYAGSASGVLNIGPPPSTLPSFTVSHTQAGGSFLWGITAGPGGLVAVGTGGTILGSGDGATWTSRTSGTANWLVAVAYGGGQYVAVGDNGCILLSADGVSWESVVQAATSARLNNVVYAAGQYVAVGEAGAIITSPDGQTWTARASGVTGWLRGLAYVGEINELAYILPRLIPARFVATGEGGGVISSTDGITWENDGAAYGRGPLTASGNLEALASTRGADFAAVGDNGISAFDIVLFQPIPPFEALAVSTFSMPVTFRGLVQGSSAVFATGENGTILTAPTFDGGWSQVPSGTSADLVGGVAIGDTVYIVGDNETILQSTVPSDSRLANLSCRTQVGTGGNILVAGFVIGGQGTSGSIPLLIRASGPALIPFDVPGTLPDPELQLYGTAAGSNLIAADSSWGGSAAISAAAAELGAFPWQDPTSHDAALLATLSNGPYTANVSGASQDTGIALAEVYDATPGGTATAASPRLVNLSARAEVGTGGNALIAGFVIGGTTLKTILVRASGPALASFGVSGTLPDPSLQIYSSTSAGAPVATNAGWAGDSNIATAAAWVGAFSWGQLATNDAAVLVTLPPGAYTANVSGASGDSGVALVEVYEVQ